VEREEGLAFTGLDWTGGRRRVDLKRALCHSRQRRIRRKKDRAEGKEGVGERCRRADPRAPRDMGPQGGRASRGMQHHS
jgi:hypothetical protein